MVDQVPVVEEQQAEGRVREIYLDIKRAMAVPYVGDVFKALATSPPMLEMVWWEIKPLVGTMAFEGLADRVRAHSDACARQHLYVPDHSGALEARGMAKATIDRIREVVEVFHCSEPRFLVIASAVRESLRSGPVGSAGHRHAPRRPPRPLKLSAPLKPVSAGGASEQIGALLADLRHALGVPFIPTSFAVLAQWSDYLELAWNDVKGQARTREFRRNCDALNNIAVGGLPELPRLVRVDAAAIRGAGIRESQLGEIYAHVEALGEPMPTLVGTTSLLHLGLNSLLEHELLELEAGA